MNNYDLAKAQQAFHPPMLEEIIQEQQEKIRQQQAEIDRLKFRIENSESLLEWENDGLKRQIQLFEDALYKAQEKIEALENDKVLHDEAYLSQMNEIEALKDDVKWLYDINVQRYPELKDGPLFWTFNTLFAIKRAKSVENRGKCPRKSDFVHNSPAAAADSQNRK